MSLDHQIDAYINSLAEPKRNDMQELHDIIRHIQPHAQLWYLDGKNEKGKVVSNPNIGYGIQTLTYAGGKTKPFYQIGLSANTTGISIYIIGLKDKSFLLNRFGKTLGKAEITGYCIKFKQLKDLHRNILEDILYLGFEARTE